jgi:glyoxylase-like metal-dependent hydrolase (beta-lactamase superfamily II)
MSAPVECNPSAYHYRIGDLQVTAVMDGITMRPIAEGFITNASLESVKAAMAEALLPPERIAITFTPVVVRNGKDTILIDTGYGDHGPATAGFVQNNLRLAGIDPSEITKVIISHFHGDHICGLTNKAGIVQFPNAEVLVPDPEWAFWMDDGQFARIGGDLKSRFQLVRDIFAPLKDRITHYRWGQEIVAGITAIEAPGHTPGHTAFALISGTDRLILISDVTNHPVLFVRNPDWSASFDIEPDRARATRHRMLDMIASECLDVAGFHFPFPAIGRIAREGQRFRLYPSQWMPLAKI